MRNLLLIVLCALSVSTFAQGKNDIEVLVRSKVDKKGMLYATWGYNRSYYRNTDVHFKGDGYDFTLNNVAAHDLPEEFDVDVYFNPTKLTIPQFDFRVGYYINNKLSVSLGWDHMKYRLLQNQLVEIDGYIDEGLSSEYGGVYNDDYMHLARDFVRFEHSDGLNFVRAGIEYHSSLWESRNGKWQAETMLGGSLGFATPWTDVHFLGERYPNWLHVAGWGASGLMAVQFQYRNRLYLQYQTQMGVLDMNDILLQDDTEARAEQVIKFTELSVSLGYNFFIKKPKGK